MKYRINPKTPILALVVVAVATNLVAINTGWIDSGFPYMNIADSIIVANEGHLVVNPFPRGPGNSLNNVANVRSGRFAIVLIPVFISKVTGVSIYNLTFFPLAGILLPIVGYLLIRRLLSSEFWGFVFGAYLALEPQGLLRNFNMNIQGYGQLFFLLVMFVVTKAFWEERKTRNYFGLTIAFFTMTVLSYYSSEFYSLSFVVLMALLMLLTPKVQSSKRLFFRNAAITCLIITVAFEPIVFSYSQQLLVGEGKDISSIMAKFANDALRILGLKVSEQTASSVVSTPPNLLLVNISLIGVIILPIVLAPILVRKKQYHSAFLAAIILTGLLDFVAYSGLEGHVDLKFLYLFFPMCSLIVLDSARNVKMLRLGSKWVMIYGVVLLIIVGLRFGLYATGPYSHISQYNPHYLNQFDTIVAFGGSSNAYLTDNVAGGKLLVSFADRGVYRSAVAYQFASLEASSFLYTGNSTELEYLKRSSEQAPFYVLISSYALESSFPAQGWSSFPPISNINRAFNDIHIQIVYQGLDSFVLQVR